MIVREPDELKPEERPVRARLLEICPPAAKASALALDFFAMVRKRKVELLDGWLARARASGLADLKSFANGLERDRAAVVNALSLEISNGQVEGQVNKLKLLKRSMYGRAKLDLLTARMVHGP